MTVNQRWIAFEGSTALSLHVRPPEIEKKADAVPGENGVAIAKRPQRTVTGRRVIANASQLTMTRAYFAALRKTGRHRQYSEDGTTRSPEAISLDYRALQTVAKAILPQSAG